jgi:transposase, IS30 family
MVDRLHLVFAPGSVGLDRVYIGNITYVRTHEGWLYLATTIDLASRRVVGFSMADHLRGSLVCDALAMAIGARHPSVGFLFHSDRGSQGGFHRSSQHLSSKELRWLRRTSELSGPSALGCALPAIHQAGVVSTGNGSGTRSPAGCRARDAAVAVGLSPAVGNRWFRQGGGMRTVSPAEPSGRYLSFAEREEIAILHAQQHGVREIARRVRRSSSTISRELRRNAATRGGQLDYRVTPAQCRRASRPKVAKLAANAALHDYVQDRLAGMIARPDGGLVAGPTVRFIGRRHGRRADRQWAKSWSPEQISQRLRRDYPDDASMRISPEAIYQALYVQGRGALKQELVACLRTGRALRVPRARTRGRGKSFVTPEILISERPAEAADRAVPGHWEGDLIVGLDSSAIGTLVERTTRFTLLLHLPPMDGHGSQARIQNGPATAGHGAEAVRDAIADAIGTMPDQLRRSLTWDQGAEMAQHAQLRIDTGVEISAQPLAARLQREHERPAAAVFPKGTDLARHTRGDLEAVASALNTRPRKTLGWKTPAEALDELLHSVEQDSGVATTP